MSNVLAGASISLASFNPISVKKLLSFSAINLELVIVSLPSRIFFVQTFCLLLLFSLLLPYP